MTKIKICGLKSEQDIDCVNHLKPDYIGFVFARKSKRYVLPERAALLSRKLCAEITPVGVFVNEPAETVAGLLADGVIRMAQLHGQEDEHYIASLRKLTDKPILKAFRIKTAGDMGTASCSSADCILLDNGAGGTGKPFDWALIQELDRPFFLAGGLDSINVTAAVRAARPYAVDTSSGVETNGCKDYAKIKSFIDAVREG